MIYDRLFGEALRLRRPSLEHAKPLHRVALVVRPLLMPAYLAAFLFILQSGANAEVRSLKLFFVNTGERAKITYKRDGHYIPGGLEAIDHILRDWRRNKEIAIDPRVIDLLWEVYRESGSREYIRVVSGYRSPATNAMLRGRSRASGVAKESQHILGKAIDFSLPDVPLERVREIGMKFQVGGVGYYPHSASPFVHMDTGGVRAWPRMSRQQLVRLFPDGRTLHLPTDGRPLPGYREALADYKRRVTSSSIVVAREGGLEHGRSGTNLLAALFRPKDKIPTASPKAGSPKPAAVVKHRDTAQSELASQTENIALAVSVRAPVPTTRPDSRGKPESTGNLATEPTRIATVVPVPSLSPVRISDEVSSTGSIPKSRPFPGNQAETKTASGKSESLPIPLTPPVLAAYVPASKRDGSEVAMRPQPLGGVKLAVGIASTTNAPEKEAPGRSDLLKPLRIALLEANSAPGAAHIREPRVMPANPASNDPDPVRFTTISGSAIRGVRLPHAGEGLTSDAIFHWASAKARSDMQRPSAASGQLSGKMIRVKVIAQIAGQEPDPGRFSAVSVAFPND